MERTDSAVPLCQDNIYIFSDRRQSGEHAHRDSCMRFALSRAALGYFKVTISK